MWKQNHLNSLVFMMTVLPVANSLVMKKFGVDIKLPFTNKQNILGVSGLTYDQATNIWTVASESILGSSISNDNPMAAVPRIYHMKLDFSSGSIDFLDGPIIINPSTGLKIEDIELAPQDDDRKSFWIVSEGNSQIVNTVTFFSKDFGTPDLSSFDPGIYVSSRILRVDGVTGDILEEASIPSFAQWDKKYDWDRTKCVGDRPFQGFHGLTIFNNTMVVGVQSAFYQDGNFATEFQGSSTRILIYDLTAKDLNDDDSVPTTAKFLKTLRYDTSQLTLASFQKGARHFNALFGIVALGKDSFLVAECEDFYGFGKSNRKVMNRIFYVEINPEDTVDHCESLSSCDVPAPTKRIIWERLDNKQLDGIAFGPLIYDSKNNSMTTLALTFEDNENIGVHFELYILKEDELQLAEEWVVEDTKANLLRQRLNSVYISIGFLVMLLLVQFLLTRLRISRSRMKIVSSNNTSNHVAKTIDLSHYALFSAMLNSFLVGGVTFGYSGMLLMLRKEGVFAEYCSCGSFCAKEKEQLAFISTMGFFVAIGSRLFVGFFLDLQGPKATSTLCSLICLSGFGLLALLPEQSLKNTFVCAWVLLSLGGSGLHITGFHFTNLFKAEDKKTASAAISAAFGAPSSIFPIMQVFNQYLEIKLQRMAMFYSILVLLVGINNFFIQPWSKVQSGIPFKVDLCFWRTEWWNRKLIKKPVLASAFTQVKKFHLWAESLFYSLALLLLTHFFSTAAQLLYEKGDKPFTGNANDWSDYMITRLAGWFNSLGFLWFPIVQQLLTNLRWSSNYFVLMCTNIIIIVILLAPSLQLQIFGFMLISFSRLLLFSCHHAYILDTFGIEFFGTLNGISSLIAASFGLLSYPLQLFSLSTSFSLSFLLIGVGMLLTGFFPFMLHRHPISNWAESYAIDPRKIRRPKTLEEVVELVKSFKKIRCAGAMHSCAPLIMSEGIILSLENFDKILEIDVKKETAKVQAGVKIHDLCNALAPHGLAMGTLGTIDWQTIAGAVMTGTHGGSLTVKSMHTFINSYTLVKASGEVIKVGKDSSGDVYSTIAPSMGLLGVVTEVEVQCVPLEYLEARLEEIPFQELESKFEDVMKSNKYARVVVHPSISKATIWTANPVDPNDAVARGAIRSKGYINFRDENEKAMLEQFLWLCGKKRFEQADDVLRRVLKSQLDRLSHYVGQYNHVLCKERNNGIPHADIEFNFDFKRNKEVIKTVKT